MVSVLAADFIAANFNSATNASFSSESRSVPHVCNIIIESAVRADHFFLLRLSACVRVCRRRFSRLHSATGLIILLFCGKVMFWFVV